MNDGPVPLNYQPPADAPLAGWGIVRWWEYRRLLYNGAMLISGMITIALTWLASSLGHQDLLGSSFNALFGALAYAFCANVCYTGGWIFDLAWKEPDPDAARRRRRAIFITGLIFSCLVTTVPLWLMIGAIVLGHL